MRGFRHRSLRTFIFTLSTLLLLALPAWAMEVPFGPEQAISTGADGARSIFAADVDGDGDLDVLSASYNDYTIAWHENTAGDGSAWTSHTITTSASSAWAVFAADLDGDGDLDALAASVAENKIAWYENADANSDGVPDTWTARTITSAASGASSVFATDVDGDGDADVLSASGNDNKVAWYENADANSDGVPDTWTARTITSSALDAVSVFAADVDGDGDADVLSASNNDNTIAWYENADANSDGVPDSWTARTITASALGAVSVFAEDVDGDGDLDALSASEADNTIAWHENTAGDGSAWTAHTITTTALQVQAVYAADVDGDGDPDVLSASFSDDTIAWHENTGGDGSAWTAHTITTVADGAVSVFAADVDGDGDPDALSAAQIGDTIAWYENGESLLRASTFGASSAITADTHQTWSVATGDVDGDGDLDLVAGNWGQANRLYLNDGRGGFAAGSDIDTDGHDTVSAILGDVDGDGDLDLIAGNWDQPNRLHLNDGTGSFGAGSDIDTDGYDTRIVALGDMDGDGDLDLVASSATGEPSRLYLNNGVGSFGAGSDIDTGGYNTTSIALGDLDADGDLDLVSGNWNQENRVYLNNGAGSFTGSSIAGLYQTRSVTLGDVDGDGDLDLVRGNESEANRLHLNNGTGVFDAGANITTDAHVTRWVTLFDVDADGDIDLVAANNGQANRLYLNDGAGSFGAGSDITSDAHASYCVTPADVDGDGDLELIAGNYSQANRLYPNRRSVFVFDETAWASMVGSTQGLDTISANVALADEVTTPPGANADMGPVLTWDRANTGLCWSFRLSALQSGAGFTFDDNEGSSAWDEALSVGDIGNWRDDDFEFDFQVGPPLRGFGFYLLDSTPEAGESYTVHGSDGQPLAVAPGSGIPDSSGHQITFVGVVTQKQDPAVDSVVFDESTDADDIGILNFRFRTNTVTDSDSDGITDCEEVSDGTDPGDPDSDSDGVDDGEDTNPLDPYACGDADSDTCEDCLSGSSDPLNDGPDADSDGICFAGDCDDLKLHCTTECTDADSDGYCVTHDCDDAISSCMTDCTDADSDGMWVCEGDCDDTTSSCTTDCTDADSDGMRVCDGDCDDTVSSCTTDCTDADSDGMRVCDGDCSDVNPNCTTNCTDGDSDGYCVTHDCSETDPNNWDSCAGCVDTDSDGYFVGCDAYSTISGPDCDDGNANCTTDCTDADSDGYCMTTDCDDASAAVYPGATQVCDGANNDCDDPLWPALGPTSWGAEKISSSADAAWSVYATDVDGDGDLDALSASELDDRIVWYENADLDSDGVPDGSWTARTISTGADRARSVFAADVDSDGDVDVLSASFDDDKIAWYESDGGSPPSFTERVITEDPDGGGSAEGPANGAVFVIAADVDTDGDVDVLSASYWDDTIAWYENADADSDGAPDAAWTMHEITTTADGAVSVSVADLDGDGDWDVLSASLLDDTVAWHENTAGDGSAWTPHTITSSADYAYSVVAADVDGDGDTDVLSASRDDDTIGWYENTDGSGSFASRQVISNSANGARSVYAADVDGDGTTDVLSASEYADQVMWYRNTSGDGSVWVAHAITTAADGAMSVFAADVDGDGDLERPVGLGQRRHDRLVSAREYGGRQRRGRSGRVQRRLRRHEPPLHDRLHGRGQRRLLRDDRLRRKQRELHE